MGESKLLKRVYTMRECVFKNKRICMHILICALINFGRKLKGLVTKAAFQEGNWDGGEFSFTAYPSVTFEFCMYYVSD